MKQRLCTFLVLASLALAASASIHLKGKVVNYSGGNVMLIQTSDTDMQNDTLQIAGDGSFEKEIKLSTSVSNESSLYSFSLIP
jgi:hypothetical protein